MRPGKKRKQACLAPVLYRSPNRLRNLPHLGLPTFTHRILFIQQTVSIHRIRSVRPLPLDRELLIRISPKGFITSMLAIDMGLILAKGLMCVRRKGLAARDLPMAPEGVEVSPTMLPTASQTPTPSATAIPAHISTQIPRERRPVDLHRVAGIATCRVHLTRQMMNLKTTPCT